MATTRILIVEDELLLARELARSLEGLDYEIAGVVTDAEAAMEMIRQTRPGLVVMNIGLSGSMDGLEAGAGIMARFDIPVVYSSGYARNDILERAEKNAPYGCLAKPLNPLELRYTMENALSRHDWERRIGEIEARYKMLFESTPAVMHSIGRDGRLLSVSDEWLRVLGYGRDEVIGRPSTDFMTEESRRVALEAMLPRFFETGDAKDVPCQFVKKNGEVVHVLLSATCERDREGQIIRTLAVLNDVTERLEAEARLEEERDKVQRYLDVAKSIIVVLDGEGDVLLINKRGCEVLGYPAEDIVGKNWFRSFLPQWDLDRVLDGFQRIMSGDLEQVERYENPVLTRSGEERIIAWQNNFVTDSKGNIVSTVSSGEDITERKRADDDLKASLKEKEVLLREVHHRVKNNLAVISSLLNLQSEYICDTVYKRMFDDTEARVRSMALAHELLYQSENFAAIEIDRYVEQLVENLVFSAGTVGKAITVRKSIDSVDFGLDTAIPLGFILTEFVSNCVKHAFPATPEGEITISLRALENDRFELVVKDDGVGMPPDFASDESRSLGFDLVDAFARQLGGKVEIRSDKGTEVRIIFKERLRG